MTIGIVGGGGWGTALAILFAGKGLSPSLWVYEAELASLMARERQNPWYLPDILLPDSIRVTNDLGESVRDCQLVILAVPSHVFRAVAGQVIPCLPQGIPVLSVTKGIEEGSLRRMGEILAELLSPTAKHSVAVLSGPTFAKEVAQGQPTAAVVASCSLDLATRLQDLLATPSFRLYTNSDVVGVELGGALKNVMAIATGISDGLGLGENARAALITRGLAEMSRLGLALGADPLTFTGLAGLGDLVLTCTGSLSRNRRVGLELGRGRSLKEIVGEMRMVAEGVKTTASALALARRAGVVMPITAEVAAVLGGEKSPREAVEALLRREPRSEVDGKRA